MGGDGGPNGDGGNGGAAAANSNATSRGGSGSVTSSADAMAALVAPRTTTVCGANWGRQPPSGERRCGRIGDGPGVRLPVAAQHYAGLRRNAPRFLAAFQFRASRLGDSVLAAIELLTQMHRENRRALPDKFPIGHLDEPEKKLILAGGKPDRPLYEVATLGALRDRLRSGDIWVEGSRARRISDAHGHLHRKEGHRSLEPWRAGRCAGMARLDATDDGFSAQATRLSRSRRKA
jgi:hypothetical protein